MRHERSGRSCLASTRPEHDWWQEREEADENKLKKQDVRNNKYAEREREREEMEAQLAAEEAEREKKREEEAQAELDKWKDLFEVGVSGEEAETEMQVSQGMLAEFITFIEEQKVVEMDELAIHFEMRTQDAIRRVEDLTSMGRLHGVIDDRGKFICITPEEMKKVAKFIKRRGRVTVTELAMESNKLIDLTPKTSVIKASTNDADATAAAN